MNSSKGKAIAQTHARRRACISLGILVGLHHAEKISFRVFAYAKYPTPGIGVFGITVFPHALRCLDGHVDGLHTDRVGRRLTLVSS